MSYTDAIIYLSDLQSVFTWLATNKPEYLAQDDQGNVTQPYTMVGFPRTPGVINGNEAMAYVRLDPDQVAELRTVPGITILAQVPYAGAGTADTLYAALFADASAKATYDAVYPRTPVQVTNPDGSTGTVTPPERFGEMG